MNTTWTSRSQSTVSGPAAEIWPSAVEKVVRVKVDFGTVITVRYIAFGPQVRPTGGLQRRICPYYLHAASRDSHEATLISHGVLDCGVDMG